MKILVVSPFLPYPLNSGGAMRVYYLMRELARRHAVSLLCPGRLTPEAAQALSFCAQVHAVPGVRLRRPIWQHVGGLLGPLPLSMSLHSPPLEERFRSLVASGDYDAVQVEFLALAHLGKAVHRAHKVLVHHFIASELRARQLERMPWGVRRLYYMVDLAKIERYERESLLWYDEHVTVSQRDALILRNWLGSARVVAIPNGVDTDYFFPGDEPEQPYSMLFVGSFGLHPANIDAALHLSRSIFPLVRRRLPQATLTIAGSGPPRSVRALAGDGVQVVADPPDIRPYMSRASLVVLPLRSGAGTKVRVACAMAMGKAVLGTPVALEGIDVVAGEHAAVEPEETFADAAVELLQDSQRRAVIGRRAREFAVTRLDWRVVGRQAIRFYEQVGHKVAV